MLVVAALETGIVVAVEYRAVLGCSRNLRAVATSFLKLQLCYIGRCVLALEHRVRDTYLGKFLDGLAVQQLRGLLVAAILYEVEVTRAGLLAHGGHFLGEHLVCHSVMLLLVFFVVQRDEVVL